MTEANCTSPPPFPEVAGGPGISLRSTRLRPEAWHGAAPLEPHALGRSGGLPPPSYRVRRTMLGKREQDDVAFGGCGPIGVDGPVRAGLAGVRAGLSEQAGVAADRVHAGRSERRALAHRRQEARTNPRPALHHRQPARRRRQHRRRGGRASRARRPHAADGQQLHPRHQCGALQEDQLRRRKGFRADQPDRLAGRTSWWSIRTCRRSRWRS